MKPLEPASGASLQKHMIQHLVRRDLATFIGRVFSTVDGRQAYARNWHIDLLASYLQKVRQGDITRLIITMPPRSLKSICVSVAFPAWLMGHDPTIRIIGVSYSSDLSNKHARDCRAVMTSPWYREVFPRTRINPRKRAENDFETTARGFRLATSIEGTLTGRGGQLIVADDLLKPADALSAKHRETVKQWLDGTMLSRLDDKKTGAIILVMQRLHVDDPVGYLLEKGGWVHLNLAAIAEQDEHYVLPDGRAFQRKCGEPLHATHEPLAVLEAMRASVGEYIFSAQYQQRPVPEHGNLIRQAWLQSYVDLPPAGGSDDRIVQSWDVAMTTGTGSDWSVCTTWAVRGETYYLLDVHRERMAFPTLKRRVQELKRQFGADDVLIEDATIGTGLIQQLKDEGVIYPIAIKPVGAKSERMAAQSAVIEAGRVFLPVHAPWKDALWSELAAFPLGKHDDQVDSISQFLGWVTTRFGRFVIIGRI